MQTPSPDCPASESLELAALGGAIPDLDSHLAGCEFCRAALERIRSDNQLLREFAVEGGLPRPREEPPPTELRIPGYRILGEAHRGGQGVVYQATQLATRRDVAIKVMRQGPFATAADRARFDREVETLARLNHPNIVAVHEAGSTGGFHYFVMNFVDGLPLDEALRAGGGVDPAALRLFIKVCEAVHAAHLRGIVHRDLKPSNIRVDRSGEPFVLDFGLAKSSEMDDLTSVTRTGQFVGSLPWAAPEQIESAGSAVDLRTDVYALGTILFQVITGRLPFDLGSNVRAALDQILLRDAPRPSQFVSRAGGLRVDDEIDTIVLKCLSKDPARRYQSADELARDLRRYLAGEAIDAKRDSALYVIGKLLRRYRLRTAAAAAFVVMLGVFAVTMSLLYRRSMRAEQQASQVSASLYDLLSQGNIEKGRMARMLGNLQQAEEMLLPELLTHHTPDGRLLWTRPPGPPEVYWSLWELYFRISCERSIPFDSASPRTASIADDGQSIRVWGRDSSIWLLSPDGTKRPEGTWGPAGNGYLSRDGRIGLGMSPAQYFLLNRSRGDAPILTLPRVAYDPGGSVLSSDATQVAIITDGAIRIFNTSDARLIIEVPNEGVRFSGVAISNDGRRVAGRTVLGGLRVYEIAGGACVARSDRGAYEKDQVRAGGPMIFSPNDSYLVDLWMATSGRVWNMSGTEPGFVPLAEWPGDTPVASFSADSRHVAIGDVGGRIRVFDAATGQVTSSWVGHPDRIRSIVFATGGNRLWTNGDRVARLWESTPGRGARSYPFQGDAMHCVAISPDGSRVLAAGGMARGVLHELERTTGRARQNLLIETDTISSVAYSPDGRLSATGAYTGLVTLGDARDFDAPRRQLRHSHRISYVCFSPDGSRLATACDDRVVRLWNVADGGLLREIRGCDDRIPGLCFDRAGRRIVAVTRVGSIFSAEDGQAEMTRLKPADNSPMRAACFSADDRLLLTAGADRTLDFRDPGTGSTLAALPGHGQEIYCIALSPAKGLVATGDAAGAIRLWDFASRRGLATLEGHSGAIMSLQFTPDGEALVSASLDGTVRDWNLGYYRRHIAGQVDAWLSRLSADDALPEVRAWREWSREHSALATPDNRSDLANPASSH